MTPESLGFVPLGPDAWTKSLRDHEVVFRSLTALAEMAPIVDMQRSVMGATDLDTISASGLVIVPETGGHVLAACIEERMAGALYGYGGYVNGAPRILSDWMGVWPEYRSAGLGAELKRLQAAIAWQAGFAEIVWTVDPLRAANARLNFEKLGAYSAHYERNRYGEEYGSGLYGGLPTDRLHMTLALTDLEVARRLRGKVPPRTAEDVRDFLPYQPGSGQQHALIEIPSDIDQVMATDREAARAWRFRLRERIESALGEGFVLCGFVPGIAKNGHVSAYLIERREGA
jgi:predicted GNAT superfamily acetyltransferase